jgi:Tol biopolymer transport system component
MLGTTLGHYRIIELLGKGGMGEVYLAEDTRLGRRVALKVLARELAGDPDRRQRFEREARAVAALNHPNIVTIHSVEEDAGLLFLTLELVEGQTLDACIPAGGLPPDRLLAWAIPLADAVGAAHQRGITHRDLKPANVMISADGRLKVLDFGLAKLKEDSMLAAGSLPTQELTGEGRIVGTVAYMSPEQAEGKPVDSRSDVFSLGVLLYEMATAERPFKGETQVSLLSAILKDTPSSISDLKRGLPRDLARIVRRCLSKDPEDRYQTAKDLRNDLRALKEDLASGELSAPPVAPAASVAAPARTSGRKGLLIAAAVGFVALVGAAAYWRMSAGSSGSPVVRPFDSVSLNRLTTTGTAGLAAISDDGRYVAYVVTEDGKAGLWLRQVATSSNVQIVPSADVRYTGVSFSPDGSHVYYSFYPAGENLGVLYQVPVLGGGARRVMDDVDGEISFEPGGRRFAFVRGYPDRQESAVMVADAEGANPKPLATRRAPNRFLLQSLAWSPDGRAIAVPADRSQDLQSEVVLVDAASGDLRTLGTHAWRRITHVAWLPDGQALLVNGQEAAGEASSQIWLMSVPDGEVRRVTNDLSTYAGLSLSADGKTFVSVRNELRARIWVLDSVGREDARAITTGAAADEGVQGMSWTPDGRLVFTSAAGGNSDIWVMDADGRNRVQLTSDPAHDTWPGITADGRQIIFVSERGGARGVWVMRIDGGEQRRLGSAIVGPRPSLSADGRWVFYSSEGKNFRIPVEGGNPLEIGSGASGGDALPEGFHEPVPSPDGTMVAGHYTDREQRGERIAVLPMDGGPARRFPTVLIPAQWSGDGKSLIYTVSRGGATNLWRQSLAGGPAEQVTKFSDETIFRYAMSHDQKRWAIVRGNTSSDVVLVSERR